MNPLPQPDQPDNYTGIHNQTRIRWVSLLTTPKGYTAHLIPGTTDTAPRRGTYCTHFNPRETFDITGLRYTRHNGRHDTIDMRGITVGAVLTDPPRLTYKDAPVAWCPNCLTMAAVEAEMISQRSYRVKTLLNRMDKPQADTQA